MLRRLRPEQGSGEAIAATLDALEQKLRALEHDLEFVGGSSAASAGDPPPSPPAPSLEPAAAPPPSGVPERPAWRPLDEPPETGDPPARPARPDPPAENPPAPGVPAPAPVPDVSELLLEARERVRQLSVQIEQLLRYRERVRRCAEDLIEDYRHALEHLPEAPPGPRRPAPEPPLLQAGRVLLDAGPFGGVGALAHFEQALRRVPEARHVEVRAFAGHRAHVEIDLELPTELVSALRRALPGGFAVLAVAPDRISLELADP